MKFDSTGKLILIVGIVLFLMSGINMCSSCSNKRSMDQMLAEHAAFKQQNDSLHKAQSREFDLRMQLLQPQIVNQFLGFFNGEQYKNEIDMNQEKINYLQQMLKNTNNQNDTVKKGK